MTVVLRDPNHRGAIMGSWGPALFSDDTACDVRDMYKDLIADGVDDAEATQPVV
jgi:hypothetical protein